MRKSLVLCASHFSTFYLYTTHLNLTFTELSIKRDVLSFLDLSDGAQGWQKAAAWRTLPDSLHHYDHNHSLANGLPFHFFLFMAVDNVMGALGKHLWPKLSCIPCRV